MDLLPKWDLHRALGDDPAADDADIRDAVLYPMLPTAPNVDIEAGQSETVLAYWDGGGAALETDTITFEPLFWDGSNGVWVRQPRFTLNPLVIGEVPALHAPRIRLRVHAATFGGAVTDVNVFATGGLTARLM